VTISIFGACAMGPDWKSPPHKAAQHSLPRAETCLSLFRA
jgi:hypothetical protein